MRKVIISCAVTGSVHTPSMSGALPVTPGEIARQSVDAARAGAAIIHLHARVPEDGRPTGDPDVFAEFLPLIDRQTNAVLNITTGGSALMSVDERIAAARRFLPELCSLNMGTMNFSFAGAERGVSGWKFGWERDYVVNSDDYVFRNTFRDIATILETLGDQGTKFEHECYDVGHLYNLAHFVDRGLVKPPFFVQMAFGILGGIGPDLRNLLFMKETADRLFGAQDYQWSALAAGRHQMHVAVQAALLGGHVRVGLEDSLYIERGRLAESNAQQVAKIAGHITALGFEIATPGDARAMLGLKGATAASYSGLHSKISV